MKSPVGAPVGGILTGVTVKYISVPRSGVHGSSSPYIMIISLAVSSQSTPSLSTSAFMTSQSSGDVTYNSSSSGMMTLNSLAAGIVCVGVIHTVKSLMLEMAVILASTLRLVTSPGVAL